MEKERQAYMVPVRESFTSYDYKNCTFIVRSVFCGWESIVPRLQELMTDRLLEVEDAEETGT